MPLPCPLRRPARSGPAGTVLALALGVLHLALPGGVAAQDAPRPLTFTDLMQLRQIEGFQVTPDASWIAFTARPDRGDPEVIVRSVDGDAEHRVQPAEAPALSDDGRWAVVRTVPPLAVRDTADEQPDPDAVVVSLADGSRTVVERVRAFAFQPGGDWLALHHHAVEEDEGDAAEGAEAEAGAEGETAPESGEPAAEPGTPEEPAPEEPEPGEPEAGEPGEPEPGEPAAGEEAGAEGADEADAAERGPAPGTALELLRPSTGETVTLEHVTAFAFSDDGVRLAYVVSDPDGDDGLYVRDIAAGTDRAVRTGADLAVPRMTWQDDGDLLAFVTATEEERDEPTGTALWLLDGDDVREAAGAAALPEGWVVKADATLRVSDDGARIFFGAEPADDEENDETEADETWEPYDLEALREDREVAVWHWRDERIQPEQENQWSWWSDRSFTAVHHVDGPTVLLEDEEFQLQGTPTAPTVALASVNTPYRVARTWDTWYEDLWLVDLATGERTALVQGLSGGAALSPEGGFVAWYRDGDWHLRDNATGAVRNVTAGLGVPFAQEDWDYPDAPSSYGIAGWTEGDRALLLYDRYEVWRVPTDGGAPVRLTGDTGRESHRVFRVVETDEDADALPDAGELLLRSFDEDTKASGFWRTRTDRPALEMLVEEEKVFHFRAAPEDADVVLYTREDFDEFPDVWVADTDFSDARRITRVNPNLGDFLWGSEELIEYTSLDGEPLQGALFKPANFDPNRRYPVLIYYYRYMSQRVHEFNEPVVNHRPSFPMYTSNGYLVFLPDVRFEVGRPGLSAVKSVVPGAQKLVDMGYADPDGLGLHGHSWSGYQTAFVVTQTDIFDAAVAGAPVSNMTSAYSGIRWGSGLARQFQYEKGQSRISGSLWEARDEYIDNSPVFFADRVETPLLIQHGDEDDAVPWYQSIEMYLALRRLQKPVVFLQYKGEPHHLRKYANKVDYSIKMMEFFDHFLKGEPAPDWWAEGVAYEGGS